MQPAGSTRVPLSLCVLTLCLVCTVAAAQTPQQPQPLPRSSLLSAAWTPIGPMQVDTPAFGLVTGRVTALAADPADTSGNTLYVGTTGGGVWKSTNAAGTAPSFLPLTDSLAVYNTAGSAVKPSLSIGALAMANGVLLAGTGDPNDATDSYYGAGILRSADSGVTWTLAQQSVAGVGGAYPFFGLSVAGLAFSSLNPSLAVAALSQAAESNLVGAGQPSNSVMGLYWSADAGQTWHLATLQDGSQTIQSATTINNPNSGNAATAVVWNPIRQAFYAAVQFHGYYTSPDGQTWTRLPNQPGAGLTTAACPVNPGTFGAVTCPIFRGALAVQPLTGDMFALTTNISNLDQGLYQDVCALNGKVCGNSSVAFGTALKATPLEVGNGSTAIAQADYNLTLAAVPSGTDTLLYAGTTDLYRCSLATGCVFRNTTNAENGCATPAGVAPAQHAILALATAANPLVYLGNDGGLWRSTDGVNQPGTPCSATDAAHFQNLNGGLGSLAEVVSFAQSPTDNATLLVGLGALGTSATSKAAASWAQLASAEGGTVAIDQTNPLLWYLSTGPGVSIARCAKGAACSAADFAATDIGPAQTADDVSTIHAPWLLDPALPANLIAGTCRIWRGIATGGGYWTATNAIARPFSTPATTACASSNAVVRSLAAGGPVSTSANAQNAGSETIYAGLAGTLDGGQSLAGHLFVTTAANLATSASVWTDAAKSSVTNDAGNGNLFNPGGYDISSIAADPHDATGATVYATVMGFHGPQVYRSTTAGAAWTNITANLPTAPANSILVDPNDANTLYVAMDTGVYVTTAVTTCTSADCWSPYGTALPNSPVVQLQAAAAMPTGDGRLGELRAATYGRGIWQIPLLTAIAAAAPAMTISPTTVTFSSEPVGSAGAAQTLTVTNTGTAPLLVSSVTTTGDFYETDTCAGTAVAQNKTCTVQVSFLPTAIGARTGVLTVYGNVSGGQATAALSGTGLAGVQIALVPATLTFPATPVGATSTLQTIVVENLGGSVASLQTPVLTGDFTLAGNSCGTTLGAGLSCTLSIAFTPTATGARTGTLTIADTAGTQAASLSGTGENPATDTLSPSALAFPAQQVNTTSASQGVSLANTGDVALTLIAAQIAGGDFAATSNCGPILAAHATCTISVTYSPRAVGVETGALTLTDEFRSQTVSLSGTGLAPPGVSLSPAIGLVFGAVGVGLTAPAQTVTLTNNGGAALAIANITANGDFSLLPGSNTCGNSLTASASCSVQVVFSPTAAGPRTGTVTFSDSAATSPQTLAVSGAGIDFSLAANGPATMTIANGQVATYALLLTSVAGLPGSAAFTCTGVPAHTLCTVNPASAGLGGTTNVSVTVATGLSTVMLQSPPMPWTQPFIWVAVLLPLGLFVRRKRVVPLALLLALTSCGTTRTVPSTSLPTTAGATTPSGNYTLVVAGSSAGLVRSVNLTLVVQ